MGDERTLHEWWDSERDLLALLRAYSAAGGQFDDASLAILANADLAVLARMLLSVAYNLDVQCARLAGCSTDEEIRAAIEERLASLQAELIADRELFTRGFEPGQPQG